MADFSALVLDGERGFARLVVACLAEAGARAGARCVGAVPLLAAEGLVPRA